MSEMGAVSSFMCADLLGGHPPWPHRICADFSSAIRKIGEEKGGEPAAAVKGSPVRRAAAQRTGCHSERTSAAVMADNRSGEDDLRWAHHSTFRRRLLSVWRGCGGHLVNERIHPGY
jgi:hypothetical protein